MLNGATERCFLMLFKTENFAKKIFFFSKFSKAISSITSKVKVLNVAKFSWNLERGEFQATCLLGSVSQIKAFEGAFKNGEVIKVRFTVHQIPEGILYMFSMHVLEPHYFNLSASTNCFNDVLGK